MNRNLGKDKNNYNLIFLTEGTNNIKNILRKYFQNQIQRIFLRKNNDEGFTFLEIILIAMVFGTLSSIAVPQAGNIVNKFRQKEATGIVNSMIKSAQSNYALFARLPDDMGEVSKFASFQKCNENNADIKGASVCRNSTPIKVKNDVLFYSPSGRYKVEMRKVTGTDGREIFQVKANPNGGNYLNNGSAVVGCFDSSSGITQIKEYSSKSSDRGVQTYIKCISNLEKERLEKERLEKEKLEKEKLEKEKLE